MKNEAQLQSECVKWFRLQYPHLKKLLFAIPNGGTRNKIEAVNLKRQGVVSGVADMFLSIGNMVFHGFYIEFKYGKNKVTQNQKEFLQAVYEQGYQFAVVRDFDTFKELIENYMKL